MQRRTITSNGKRYLVNVPGGDDFGVGAGFSVGQMVLKSYTDLKWYVVTASGSQPSVVPFVSQSALPFATSSLYYNPVGPYQPTGSTASFTVGTNFFDQNWPFQLLASSDGNTYKVYLSGSAPTAALLVSQSMYASYSYVTTSYYPWGNAQSYTTRIDTAKPFLMLQNITDGNYYRTYLVTVGAVTSLVTNQQMVSQSWVQSIY